MKKKILSFLLVLASVIACIVCLAACGNGGASRAEYVGKYECITQTVVSKLEGSDKEETMTLTKQDAMISTLELKDDGSFYMEAGMYGGRITQTGEWSVSKGKLNLTVNSGTSKFDCSLTDGTLTLNYQEAYGGVGSAKIEIKLKKLTEGESDNNVNN